MGISNFWCYGGREYPFDISEAECMKAVGDSLGALKTAADELEARVGLSPHETIDEQCEMIGAFFDGIFGDGEGEKICGKRHSLEKYSNAYVEFIVFLSSQVEAFASMRESIEARYADRICSAEAVGTDV